MEKYQTFWRRLGAGIIDGFVLLPLGLLDYYLSKPDRHMFILIVWSIFSYSSFWLYNVYFHVRSGQTIGKKVTGVKVLDVSEERIPTLKQAFMRDSFYALLNTAALLYFIYLVVTGIYFQATPANDIPGMIITITAWVWFILEIITMAMNPKSRAFHDYLAKTVVVKNV